MERRSSAREFLEFLIVVSISVPFVPHLLSSVFALAFADPFVPVESRRFEHQCRDVLLTM